MAEFTPGRFVMASTDAIGARDGAGMLAQCKHMRTGMESVGRKPALILVAVDEPELKAAERIIALALEPVAAPPSSHASEEDR